MLNYINILKYAMDREKEGQKFFEDNASRFSSPVSKALFEKLAGLEQEHYDFLKEQVDYYINNKSVKPLDEKILNREENLFVKREDSEKIEMSLSQSDVPDLAIMRMAYLIEKDFAEYYKDAAEKATDEDAKKLFTMLSNWELGHEKLFKDEYNRLMEEYMTLPWGG
ncbi:MAG: ferritin family protein [Lutispora sp.]|nr:ferritin family protein [Lutispora sp.]MDD4833280.1 ferritin family protein [Lutispora sp.]